jgi:hypothetical protein
MRADLKAYLDGELSLLQGWLVRGHLSRCTDCREEVIWLKRLGEDMRELERATPRPELRARIMASLPETLPARVSAPNPVRRSVGLVSAPRFALAGSLILLLAGGVFALNHYASAPAPAPTTAVTRPLPSAPLFKTERTASAAMENAGGTRASAVAVPLDEVTAEANRRWIQHERERLRRQEEVRRAIARTIPGAITTPKPANAAENTPLLLLTLEAGSKDIAWVRQRLKGLAQQMGGDLVVKEPDSRGMNQLYHDKLIPDPTQPGAMIHPTETSALPHGGEVVTLRIRTQYVTEFLRTIQRYGRAERVITRPAAARLPDITTQPAPARESQGPLLVAPKPGETSAALLTLRVYIAPPPPVKP